MTTAEIATQSLDRQAFADWLRAQAPDAVVGESSWSAHCPLSRYLRALGCRSPNVGRVTYGTARGAPDQRLPEWAAVFAQRADWCTPPRRPITAAVALSILASVPED